MGIDVHKRLVNITGMEEDGTVRENYETEKSKEAWDTFVERCTSKKTRDSSRAIHLWEVCR